MIYYVYNYYIYNNCKRQIQFILSEKLDQSHYSGRNEEELKGVADGRQKAAASQLCSTLHPKPAGWNRVAPAENADK